MSYTHTLSAPLNIQGVRATRKSYVLLCAELDSYFVTFFSIKPNPLAIRLLHAYTRTDRQRYFNNDLERWERTKKRWSM